MVQISCKIVHELAAWGVFESGRVREPPRKFDVGAATTLAHVANTRKQGARTPRTFACSFGAHASLQ